MFFAGGFLIGARHVQVLDWARRHAWLLLSAAVMLFAVKAGLLALALLDDVPTGQALAAGGWVPAGLEPAHATLFSAVEAATAWAWCLAAVGLAARFLDRPSRLLGELNRAVYPGYVLHFPVTLVGLALTAQLSWPWWVEFVILLVAVYVITWLLWRLADRLGAGAYLVGGRPAAGRGPAGV